MTGAENLSLIFFFFSLKITHRLFTVPSTAGQGYDFEPVIIAGFSFFFVRASSQLKSVICLCEEQKTQELME